MRSTNKRIKITEGVYVYRGFSIEDHYTANSMQRWTIKATDDWRSHRIANAPTLQSAIRQIDERYDDFLIRREVDQ